jgi:hypothetical protein
LLDDILSALGPRVAVHKPNGEITFWCPFHPDGAGTPPHNPNGVIKLGTKGAAYVWACPVCNIGGTLLQLAERLREIGVMAPRDGERAKPIAAYDYRDEGGRLVFQVLRLPNKAFPQRRPDGNGGWAWNLEGVQRIPYRLPQLLAADLGLWVHVVEGEKDANNLNLIGLVATTNPGGAGKWRQEFGPYFKGRQVAILPDNDAPGQAHAQDVAHKLAPHAAEVRIVNLPGLSPGGDVSDWVKGGRTAEELAVLVDAAPTWGTDILPDNLAPLLDDVRVLIRRYVIVDDAQADALALWAAHTHALAAAEATPYLAVNSAEKRSGKTRLLEVLSLLSARSWLTGRVTAAVLVRKLAKGPPTLLLDESDAAFKAEKEYAAALQAILNSGYRRGGIASFCDKGAGGFDLRDVAVFGPKAIAGIGGLPDTIADRSIPIALKRRAPSEPVARFRWRDAQEEAKPLREGLACWASANVEALTEARPDIPSELDDRAADVWEPLLAIADAAGGYWPQRARTAALSLSVGERRDNDSLGVRLLADIRAIFDERKTDRLSSVQLADALVANEEAPWGDLRDKALEPRTLARLLRPYEVKPHVIRLGDATARGYERADFEDAWARYIPTPEISATTVTSVTTTPSEYERERPDVTDVTDVTANTGYEAPLTERDDRPPAVGGHLVSLALEMGARLVEKGG